MLDRDLFHDLIITKYGPTSDLFKCGAILGRAEHGTAPTDLRIRSREAVGTQFLRVVSKQKGELMLGWLLALWLAPQQSTATPPDVGPKQVGDVALRLQCGESSGIRFTLANTGSTDTTLMIGANVGNGSKYMITVLKLSAQIPGQPAQAYQYSPNDYPAAIGGRLDEWLQALPARAEFSVTAKPDDFLAHDRPKDFQKGSALTLTMTVPAPRPQALMLRYWAGTLTSNTCVMN